MSLQTWQETLVTTAVDGNTLTAAATATMIPPTGLITIPPNWWYVGRMMKVTAHGRISVANPTPGAATFLVKQTASVFSSGAIPLNTVVAKTTVPFWLELIMTCRSIGAAATLFGYGQFQTEAVLGSPANAAGGQSSYLVPVGTPAVGASFDSTIAQILDLHFTQTVATGSLTCHMYKVEALN
jgi:hypothetical protein